MLTTNFHVRLSARNALNHIYRLYSFEKTHFDLLGDFRSPFSRSCVLLRNHIRACVPSG